VQLRQTEDCHYGVADELLDDPAVSLDCTLSCVEVTRHEAAQHFGIEPLSERSRTRYITEQDRDRLSGQRRFQSPGCRRHSRPNRWRGGHRRLQALVLREDLPL
jgi:hypothetical protein